MKVSEQQLRVVFVLKDVGFPNGMAATQRVKLLAKALTERDTAVSILITHVTERGKRCLNEAAYGVVDSVRYEYMPGKTRRSDSFLRRRFDQVIGAAKTLGRLWVLRRRREVDAIYFWVSVQYFSFDRCLYLAWAKLLRIPVIQELNERPWLMKEKPTPLERWIHPLWCIDGVISISHFLEAWASEEAIRLRKKITCVRLPIVYDDDESMNDDAPVIEKVFVYAAAKAYESTLQFILESFTEVWRCYPDYKLSITGYMSGSQEEAHLRFLLASLGIEEKVRLEGFLSRPELLNLYRASTGLLIPLFNDTRSQARFPTKIAEYLASGRPVIATSIGEIPYFLRHEENAFLCVANDSKAYAYTIIHVIENPSLASAVGKKGRHIAVSQYQYSLYGKELEQVFRHTGSGRQREQWH